MPPCCHLCVACVAGAVLSPRVPLGPKRRAGSAQILRRELRLIQPCLTEHIQHHALGINVCVISFMLPVNNCSAQTPPDGNVRASGLSSTGTPRKMPLVSP